MLMDQDCLRWSRPRGNHDLLVAGDIQHVVLHQLLEWVFKKFIYTQQSTSIWIRLHPNQPNFRSDRSVGLVRIYKMRSIWALPYGPIVCSLTKIALPLCILFLFVKIQYFPRVCGWNDLRIQERGKEISTEETRRWREQWKWRTCEYSLFVSFLRLLFSSLHYSVSISVILRHLVDFCLEILCVLWFDRLDLGYFFPFILRITTVKSFLSNS